MDDSSILDRFRQMAPSLPDKAQWHLICEGECLYLQTAERAARRSRLLVRLGGGLGVLAGLILALSSPWGWAVIGISLLVLLFAPRFIRSRRLLQIDTAEGQLILLQNTGAEVGSLPLEDLQALHGVYETKGWDPYTVVYAQTREGSKVPILLLMGGSEKIATEACRLLGNLLDCPADYTGPFGEILSCYTSATVK